MFNDVAYSTSQYQARKFQSNIIEEYQQITKKSSPETFEH